MVFSTQLVCGNIFIKSEGKWTLLIGHKLPRLIKICVCVAVQKSTFTKGAKNLSRGAKKNIGVLKFLIG